jgi:hypothetical protein
MRFRHLIATLIALLTFLSSPTVDFAQSANSLVDEYPVVTQLTPISERYVDELNDLVNELIQDGTHRDYPGLFLSEDWNKYLWFKGFEISTLASIYPYLYDQNKVPLKTFLSYEVSNYLLNDAYLAYELNDSGVTNQKLPGGAYLGWWQWRSVDAETLYGLWAYAQYTNDWTIIQNNWTRIKTIKNNIAGTGSSKKIIASGAGGIHEQAFNSVISGKIAYARMAKKLFAVTRSASYNQDYQQIVSELPASLAQIDSIIHCGYLECQISWDAVVASCLANIAQLDFLTPSLARWYAENYLADIETAITDAETRDPWWYMGSYNIMPGRHTYGNSGQGDDGAGCGEGYFESPLYSYQIFQGKARILQVSTQELITKLPVATTTKTIPIYWDILNYSNLSTLIERLEGASWIDTNMKPPALRVSLSDPANEMSTTNVTPSFTWEAVTGVAHYEVQLGTSNPPVLTIAYPTTNSYTPPAPLLYKTYYWRVRAIYTFGSASGWSGTRSLFITPAPLVSPPRNYFNNEQVILTWNAVSWAEEYEVQVDAEITFMNPLEYTTIVPKETLEVTTSSLLNGTHYWRVRARDAMGNPSGWSIIEGFVVDAPES